ncbi:hypothetical protein [Lacipirellula limnantheis]|uniref:Uncharacterized protein n=1 Tax=Lacipirellula limnantheis TaxID=2528024 RepID=A0A517U1F2_9BACT|nr:hypothetical protein [Lacipirellula limnantheis]QDT74434.1 hypothetical protein I41_36300 [Lacipirellula limnantheis]
MPDDPIERFWHACIGEFADQRVLRALGEAIEWVSFAESYSSHQLGEQPELDDAFDEARAAISRLRRMLGGE